MDSAAAVALFAVRAVDRGRHAPVIDEHVVQPDPVDIVGTVGPRANRPLGPLEQVITDIVVEAVVGQLGINISVREDVVATLVKERSRRIVQPAEWLRQVVDRAVGVLGRHLLQRPAEFASSGYILFQRDIEEPIEVPDGFIEWSFPVRHR